MGRLRGAVSLVRCLASSHGFLIGTVSPTRLKYIAAPIEDAIRLGGDDRRNMEQEIADSGNDMKGNGYASTASQQVTGTPYACNHAPVGRPADGPSIGRGRAPTGFWGSE